jgi:hypothetical protein
MLHHEYTTEAREDFNSLAQCLSDPVKFMERSRYVYLAERLDSDKLRVVFKWRKLDMTRYYEVVLTVKPKLGPNRVGFLLEPTPESKYDFFLSVEIEKLENRVLLKVRSWMYAGLMADILGRKDYREFVEELVEKGVFCSKK